MSIFGFQNKKTEPPKTKNYMTIVSSYKGPLKSRQLFVFGNECTEGTTRWDRTLGYVTALPVKIITMAVSISVYGKDNSFKFIIDINGEAKPNYSLECTGGGIINKSILFDYPLKVNSGDSINVINIKESKNTYCTILNLVLDV